MMVMLMSLQTLRTLSWQCSDVCNGEPGAHALVPSKLHTCTLDTGTGEGGGALLLICRPTIQWGHRRTDSYYLASFSQRFKASQVLAQAWAHLTVHLTHSRPTSLLRYVKTVFSNLLLAISTSVPVAHVKLRVPL